MRTALGLLATLKSLLYSVLSPSHLREAVQCSEVEKVSAVAYRSHKEMRWRKNLPCCACLLVGVLDALAVLECSVACLLEIVRAIKVGLILLELTGCLLGC